MTFYFRIKAKRAAQVRLEYAVDYVKTNGSRLIRSSAASLESKMPARLTAGQAFLILNRFLLLRLPLYTGCGSPSDTSDILSLRMAEPSS